MDSSPFATLAPEMRNRIYEYVLQQPQTVTIQAHGIDNNPRITPLVELPQALALTATCKQVRDECTLLFYASNDFLIRQGHGDSAIAVLNLFSKEIGKRCSAALRSLTVELDVNPYREPYYEKVECSLYSPMRGLRLLTLRYGWSHVKAEVLFCTRTASEQWPIELDMVDLDEPWDKFDAAPLHSTETAYYNSSFQDFENWIRLEVQDCRERLKAI